MRVAAMFGKLARPASMQLDRSTVSGRSICDLEPVHVTDLQNADDEFAAGREYAIKFGHRSILAVPLVREGRALGTIMVRRAEVRPFEQKDIALLTTFAHQAAIAIENVRLFNAEQQRTRELSESPGAADGDIRSAACDLKLARRIETGIQHHPRERDLHLHRQIRRAVSRRKCWRISRGGAAQRTAPLRRSTPAKSGRNRATGHCYWDRSGEQTAMPDHRYFGRACLRQRSGTAQSSEALGRAHHVERADAERRRSRWADRDLSSGGFAVRQQADRPGSGLRRPGRHRHREHAAAQRITTIERLARTADRDLRSAQDHQPLDLRSADRARYARGIRPPGSAKRRQHRSNRAQGNGYRGVACTASRPNSRRSWPIIRFPRRARDRSSAAP